MKNLVLSLSLLISISAQATGSDVEKRHDREDRTRTSCFCANSGCSTGYTSRGNVILNIVTTDSRGFSNTQCIEYQNELTCIQAMSACN